MAASFAFGWLGLSLAGALGAVWLAFRSHLRLATPHVFALLLFGYLGLSLAWSSDPKQGLWQLQNTFGLLILFFVAPYLKRFIGPGVSLALAVGVYLAFTSDYSGGFGNENFVTEYLLIAMPLALAGLRFTANISKSGSVHLMNTLSGVVGMFGCAGALIYLFTMNDSKIEWFVVFMLVLMAVSMRVASTRREAVTWVVVGILASFFLIYDTTLWGSIEARLETNINTFYLWMASPFFGNGFGSFVYEYPRFETMHQEILPFLGTVLVVPSMHVGAAHNEYLELLSEGGIIAGILAAGIVLGLPRPKDHVEKCAFAALVIAGLIALIEFPVQNPHTAILIALALGLVAGKPKIIAKVRARPLVVLCAIILAGVLSFGGVSAWAAHMRMHSADRYHVSGMLLEAMRLNVEAANIYDLWWRTRAQLVMTVHSLEKAGAVIGNKDQVREIGDSASPLFLEKNL